MLKRFSGIIALFLLLFLFFAACDKNKTNNAPSTNHEKQPEAEQIEKPIVTYPPKDLDLDAVQTITSQGMGYNDILRLKSTKEILFSPEIHNLQERLNAGESLSDFTVELVFILLDEEGKEYYAYPEIKTELYESRGGTWFDIFLQSEDMNCGFCPTAGRYYTIELSVYDKDDHKIMEGVWKSIKASDAYTESPYYEPTAIPSEKDRAKLSFQVQYLPVKGGVLHGQSKQTLKFGQGSQKVTAVADKGYLFVGWSDGYAFEERSGDVFVRNKVIYALFEKVVTDGSVPNMYIQTETGAFITSKEEYLNATIRIVGAVQDKYNITVTTQIRGRGNSSFSGTSDMNDYWGKNSYRLKLDEKANLLGVGGSANRDWVLNSNKHDASGLRNYTVWNLAKQMNTMPFVPGCTWVNLYLNGDYRGVYMLTDHVEVANDRVEVEDSLKEPDKGYLVELDFRGDSETGAVEGLTYFYVSGFDASNTREWVIKSDVFSVDETNYIRNYIEACHKAIMLGDRATIDQLVDIPSLIDMLIVEELSKDVDAGGASLFMQKDKGGKLYFTAPWDFDFGFGSHGPATYTHGFVCKDGNGHVWFAALLKQNWFLRELKARMVAVTDMIETTKKSLWAVGEMLTPASDHQDERWNIYGNHYHPYITGAVSEELNSYEEHVQFICDWIDQRWSWMCSEINRRVG